MTGGASPTTSLAILLSDKLMAIPNLTTRVPLLLDVDEMNYSSWMHFFQKFCCGYNLLKHILGETKTTNDTSSSEPKPPTAEWLTIDSIVLTWIFTTLSKTVQQRLVVENPTTTKADWTILALIFNDNKRSRSIALKAELRSMKLGDLSNHAYFRKIESITTILSILGSPISNDDVDPFLDLKTIHSMLTTAKMQLKSWAQDTLIDSTPSSPMVLFPDSGTNAWLSTPSTKNVHRQCFNFKKGSCCFGVYCKFFHNGVHGIPFMSAIRTSGSIDTSSSSLTQHDIMNLQGIMAKLRCSGSTNIAQPMANNSVQTSSGSSIPLDPSPGNWNMDTGANSHHNNFVSSLSDVFNLCIYSSVSVGDGYSKPVTNSSHNILSTPHRPLHLDNVLITPNIVKNLISVRQFVYDNSCTVEFGAFGISVKDFLTRRVLIRCDSTGDLYPVMKPSNIPHAFLTSLYTWHQHLGHQRSPLYDFLDDSSNVISNIIRSSPTTHPNAPNLPTDTQTVNNHAIPTDEPNFDGSTSPAHQMFLGPPSPAHQSNTITGLLTDPYTPPDSSPLNTIHATGLNATHDTCPKILKRAQMVGCNSSRSLIDIKSKLSDDGDPVSALKRILRYDSGTLDYGLQLFSSSTTDLVAYSNAHWAGYPTTRRSTSEAEYHGVANAVAETCWLRNLLRELYTPLSSATLIYCDNVSVVYLSLNPVQHQRTKHIEIYIHFVRDLVAASQVRVFHVPSRYQYADIFTKGLPSAFFEEFRTSLSVRCPPAQTTKEC
nr:ribonuclease H-like domain-containing protein [Tanacetum cinerariifolium]